MRRLLGLLPLSPSHGKVCGECAMSKTSWSTPRRVTFSCGAIKRGKAAESVPSTSTFDLHGFVRLQLPPADLCIVFVEFLQSEIGLRCCPMVRRSSRCCVFWCRSMSTQSNLFVESALFATRPSINFQATSAKERERVKANKPFVHGSCQNIKRSPEGVEGVGYFRRWCGVVR